MLLSPVGLNVVMPCFLAVPPKTISGLQLQYYKTSAAHVLMKIKRRGHSTPILKSPHWLPMSFRFDFKVQVFPHFHGWYVSFRQVEIHFFQIFLFYFIY